MKQENKQQENKTIDEERLKRIMGVEAFTRKKLVETLSMRTETFTQFKQRISKDSDAFHIILEDYFSSHPDYNEKTKRIEEVV